MPPVKAGVRKRSHRGSRMLKSRKRLGEENKEGIWRVGGRKKGQEERGYRRDH